MEIGEKFLARFGIFESSDGEQVIERQILLSVTQSQNEFGPIRFRPDAPILDARHTPSIIHVPAADGRIRHTAFKQPSGDPVASNRTIPSTEHVDHALSIERMRGHVRLRHFQRHAESRATRLWHFKLELFPVRDSALSSRKDKQ